MKILIHTYTIRIFTQVGLLLEDNSSMLS